MIFNTTFLTSTITDRCNAILKTGNRKNQICGATKKKTIIIDGFLQPRCNRHIKKTKLDKLQEKAYNLCINSSDNIFVTGSAGVGKSLLISKIKDFFENNLINYALTSSTGISSININGQTIQSFFGLKSYITKLKHVKDDNDNLIYKLNKKIIKKIKNLDVLIIDEISMIDANLFDIVEYISRKIKKNNKVFGGIRLIIVGDFLQLPPVPCYEDRTNGIKYKYCFESNIWKKLKLVNIMLNKSHRHNDKLFYDILLNIRLCKINEKILKILNKKIIKENDLKKYEDWTILFSSNYQKDIYNNMKLNNINYKIKNFECSYIGNPKYNKLFVNIPDKLILKIGAYIMLTKNIYINNILYINGDNGKIIDFDDEDNPIVIFNRFPKIKNVIKKQEWNIYNMIDPINPKILATKIQYPLVLGWAMTIHKSQGLTLDKVIIDFSDIFLNGQAYVALSRCKTLKNLKLLNFDHKKITINNKIINFYNNLNFL